MKSLLFTLFFSCIFQLNAQNNDSEVVKETIKGFFEAFHKQDTLALNGFANPKVVMQSISVNQDGIPVISETTFPQFLKSIAGIPKTVRFEERLLSYNINVDGLMANAWTDYEFYVNDKLSHKGVNSFQLIKKEGKWLIFYLVDTRRK